ncbi:hypothetical protein TWF788_007728 [Orbilia oligospora]|uniref:Uncharacterized protein n=1 Tax=Orbilia oligospora TaxID=2813651 RepID=A0A7C8PS20_ORBOL|nr:hypothetical protein TWF788_007728 [Orbilia oligospora]
MIPVVDHFVLSASSFVDAEFAVFASSVCENVVPSGTFNFSLEACAIKTTLDDVNTCSTKQPSVDPTKA